jgi:hypothetical protein
MSELWRHLVDEARERLEMWQHAARVGGDLEPLAVCKDWEEN